MADSSYKDHGKSHLVYGRLVVSTGTSTQVVAYSKYRPTASRALVFREIYPSESL